ncbi:MAG: Asp-tRNA(Asn)/Glu-tRNA(Gln) amidotransferase subunit GatC [Bacillus sp. (in: Bacteria)]|nr:Asp-tRNA(Asn)/Glu-tRNA(Gln) amidotransferase subunit GatC [Bacillus sp. (in: firmicutes)]
MKRITQEQVKHVANLARLEFTDAEIELFTQQLDDIIVYAEQLNELDTTDVEPTSHVLDVKNVLREDEVKPSKDRDEVLKNAPAHEGGQFKVPSVLE